MHHLLELPQVTTVDGDVDLKIPSGVQPGTTLVMGKRGVPRLGGSGRGDHMVSLNQLRIRELALYAAEVRCFVHTA